MAGLNSKTSMANIEVGSNRIQRYKIIIVLIAIASLSLLRSQSIHITSTKVVVKSERFDQRLVTNHEVNTTDENCVSKSYWCLDLDQTPRFIAEKHYSGFDTVLSTVQHFSHYGFDKCLANKTVVFIGDSRVRYQYMNLVSFLKNERFMKCRDYTNKTDEPECFLIDHAMHMTMTDSDWNSWYTESTNMLSSLQTSLPQQISICDCFRPSPFNDSATYENRYTRRETSFGETNLSISKAFAIQFR